jgi:antitoxin PrlF
MPTATLTSKGQITVPQSVRQALGLHAGTKVDFVPLADGFKVVAVQGASAAGLKGRFAGRVAKAVSVESMNEAIATEATGRHARSSRKKA